MKETLLSTISSKEDLLQKLLLDLLDKKRQRIFAQANKQTLRNYIDHNGIVIKSSNFPESYSGEGLLTESLVDRIDRWITKTYSYPAHDSNFSSLNLWDKVSIINMEGTATDHECYDLLSKSSKVKKINFRKSSNLRTPDLNDLPNLAQVEEIDLSQCTQLTDQGLRNILSKMTGVRKIDLGWCDNLQTPDLNDLPNLAQVEEIYLSECTELTDQGLRNILSKAINAKFTLPDKTTLPSNKEIQRYIKLHFSENHQILYQVAAALRLGKIDMIDEPLKEFIKKSSEDIDINSFSELILEIPHGNRDIAKADLEKQIKETLGSMSQESSKREIEDKTEGCDRPPKSTRLDHSSSSRREREDDGDDKSSKATKLDERAATSSRD